MATLHAYFYQMLDVDHTGQNIKVFISYRNIEPSNHCARVLNDRLSSEGSETFLDIDELKGDD